MDDQNKNLILASVLSFVVIIVWFVLFPPPEPIQTEEQNNEQTQAQNLPASCRIDLVRGWKNRQSFFEGLSRCFG